MCATAAETQAFGEQLGAALEAGDLVILKGPVGAGKTTLTQGIARGMRVSGRVTSPTFVIAREHPSEVGGPSLIHVDAYRLGSTGADPLDEIDALDLDTDLTEAVVVAEWGEGLMEQLSTNHLVLTLDRSQDVRELSWEIVS
ncbi:tRNA (adenosine(37)-N6)-threonylcarbamoyltransferase complex ATPase subunit type 1 TsaE [Corynebacterium tapiri]|uniref:tRNA threonylcarbamoyladenosine biosynthesis protein TsaE n=2 Tax=Corynebacterium tapiri TaxID=1448266 RepID=A0A5C4U4L2_9CORY|nr:tRNA (adenosine(37)-N6)-threonylcarbamoyltransferase complex ATPase subunit type 1 TsaE [Corynebacterium tapiri]TNL98602.1 tRNA (adenosine(37)-N6)-threonylcarbamoyltransferase complex ATPase subunit type 1 TsaE [Corynebacterium tapiri]